MRIVTECRICGSKALMPVLDLGAQPPVNVLSPKIAAARYPLELLVCCKCWHGQLSVVVSKDVLYDDYSYASSTIDGLWPHFEYIVDLATEVVQRDTAYRSVLEIACNDGPQLLAFRNAGWTVQGVDPALNLVKRARDRGLPVACGYWGQEIADSLYHPHGYNLIVAQNVLGHVDNPRDFLDRCDEVLAPNGRLFLQTSHANWLINGEFDTVYHEHLSYFNCSSWAKLLRPAGWAVERLLLPKTNGTSYLLVVGRREDVHSVDQRFLDRLAFEEQAGYYLPATYAKFGRRVEKTLAQLRSAIDSAQHGTAIGEQEYFVVFGYGAAAKGITALLASGAQLEFIVDDSPLKQGKEIPFLNTPIVAPSFLEQIRRDRPWFVMITAGLYREEIKAKLKASGGHGMLCTYLPEFHLEAF